MSTGHVMRGTGHAYRSCYDTRGAQQGAHFPAFPLRSQAAPPLLDLLMNPPGKMKQECARRSGTGCEMEQVMSRSHVMRSTGHKCRSCYERGAPGRAFPLRLQAAPLLLNHFLNLLLNLLLNHHRCQKKKECARRSSTGYEISVQVMR